VQAVPDDRLADVLAPYRSDTTLVRRAAVGRDDRGIVHLAAETAFGPAAHRPGATTLDPSEANILYNQMLYVGLGECVARGLHPLLAPWDWATFRRRQLPDVLILQFSLTLPPRGLVRAGLRGTLRFPSMERKRNLLLIHTEATFLDADAEGHARVVVAIVDTPPALPELPPPDAFPPVPPAAP